MRISDWSADVCSSDLLQRLERLDTIGAPDFDAVLLPDTGQTLRVAAASLAYYDANRPPVRLLGLRNLDQVRTLGPAPALLDACYAAPPREGRRRCAERVEKSFDGGTAGLARPCTAHTAQSRD